MDYSSNSEVTVFWRREGYQSLAPQRVGGEGADVPGMRGCSFWQVTPFHDYLRRKFT